MRTAIVAMILTFLGHSVAGAAPIAPFFCRQAVADLTASRGAGEPTGISCRSRRCSCSPPGFDYGGADDVLTFTWNLGSFSSREFECCGNTHFDEGFFPTDLVHPDYPGVPIVRQIPFGPSDVTQLEWSFGTNTPNSGATYDVVNGRAWAVLAPEPGAAALLGIGLLGAGLRRARRKRGRG